MATSDGHHCVVCNKDTDNTCAECTEGLDIDLQPAPTYYCGRSCRRADTKKHKTLCKLANDRKVLRDAAILLHNIFKAIRLHAFDVKIVQVAIDKAEVEGEIDKLHLYEGKYEKGETIVDFPEGLSLSHEDRQALLTWCACSDALFTMSKMVESALKGQ